LERRIAAILASDMVGYSRLVELDEAGTLTRQKKLRLELIDPQIERFHGRIVKLTGDGLIAEFGSVVEAVQAAVTVQQEMAAREADVPEDRRIRYRIAVHLGDVVFDDGDVYGDGVNVAARLEGLAQPGGVVVSGAVYDMLKSQVDVGYRSLGEKQLKNIATPVRVYQVTDTREVPQLQTRRRWRMPLVAAVIALALFSGFGWWSIRSDITPARPEELAFSVPEKPSIAVAPFANVTGNDEIKWLSTGLSANVISALSSSPDMVVISQNALSDMTGVEPGKIAERYGVRYVLDGTVQSDAQRLRVSARLADAIAGRILWSQKWDRSLDDVFAIQDEIADAILEELQVRLTIGEQARSWRVDTGSVENMRALIEGRVAFQTFTPDGHEVVSRLWGGIYERNPDLPMSMGLKGWLHWHKVMVRLSTDPVADLTAAQDWAQMAIDAGLGGNPHVLYATASNYLLQPEKALAYAEEGLRAAPGEADVVQVAGFVYSLNGRLEEGINLMEQGMRLEPDYPDWLAGAMVNALLKAGRLDDARGLAVDMLDNNVRDVNAKFTALISLVVLSAWQDKPGEARRYMGKLLAFRPGVTVAEMREKPRYGSFGTSEEDIEFGRRYVSALAEAGMPSDD